MEYDKNFISLWERMENRIRGKMLSKIEQQEINLGLANLLLKQELANWFANYNAEGRWLVGFSQEMPDKAEMIREILKNEVMFQENLNRKKLNPLYKVVLPAAGAVIGGGIAIATGQTMLIKAASTVIPAGLMYGGTLYLEKGIAEQSKSQVIEGYFEQLTVYKDRIVKILQNH